MLRQITRSKLFIKTFLSYMVILIVPILVYSIFSYYYSVQKSTRAAITQCDKDARNTVSLINDQLINIQTLGGRVNMLSWVWKISAETNIFDSDFNAVHRKEIIDDLRILLPENGLMNNMILLFPKKNMAVSLNGWFEIDSYFDYLGEDKRIQEFKKNLTQRYNNNILNSDKLVVQNRSVLWLTQSIDPMNQPRAQLVFLIDVNKFKSFIHSISPDGLCSLIIYSMDEVPIVEIKGNGNSKSGNTFSVTMPSNALGWKYHMVFDASIAKKKQNGFLTLIITLLCTILIGPLSAFLLAYASYRPLKRMMSRIVPESGDNYSEKKRLNEYSILESAFSKLDNDNKHMQNRVREYSKYTQNDMLVRLIKGYFYQNELHEDLPYYGIDYSEDNSFAVLIIRFNEDNIRKDERLKKIMMTGLVIEKMLERETFDYKIIDVLEEDIIVIFSDCNNKLDSIQIDQFSDKLQNVLTGIDNIESRIWQGKIEQGILGISKSYHSAKEAANMSNFAQYIQQRSDVTKSFYYPTDWEIQLINNLKMGRGESSANILDAIRTENEKQLLDTDTQEALYKSINNTIARVASELNLDWFEQEMDKHIQQYKEKADFSQRTATKQWAIIYGLCHMICARTTYQKQENIDISDRILEYINQNYTNAGLSLKEIASDLDISLSAASKAFKNRTGINFYDYTCRLRMEEAKNLTKENSKLTVKEICKTVGYENEFSFRRTFLRYEGVSISDYRNSLNR